MRYFTRLALIGASALLAVAGCTAVERLEEEAINDNQTTGQELTIWATREGEPETKTIRNASDGAVLWVPNDAISLFYGSGTDGGSRFVSNATEATSVTNFTGTITAITGGADVSLQDTYFWGVYPYRDDVSCDGTTVTMTLPTQQKAVAGTFDTMLFPSIGRSQGLNMGFYNVCGGWRFSVTKEGVRKVTLKSNNGEIIAGKIKVGLDSSGIPFVSEIVDGSDEVVLECPRGEYFEVGKNYYFVLLPGTIASGFTMTFETYTEEGVYVRTASTKINRSGFQGVSNLDNYLSTPYHQKTGNIPVEDSNFKTYLTTNFDTNNDGEISYAEAATITEINTFTNTISSVQGIEYMPNLITVTVQKNELVSGFGQLESLDVTNNVALVNLVCRENTITSLDVSNNTALTKLECYNNQLTSLDVSNNTALTYLDCGTNQLTSLDVSGNVSLVTLICGENLLTSLSLPNRFDAALEELYCSNNQLTTLDLSNNMAMTYLYCENNRLTSLDVYDCMVLSLLDCSSNLITSLNVSNCPDLTNLDCTDNQIQVLNVWNNTLLTQLKCGFNQLSSLNVANNTALTNLNCYKNNLSSLDLSHNAELTDLSCHVNQITSLDVSNNTLLSVLNCSENQISSLNLSENAALRNLICNNNPLTALDLSNNTLLGSLTCFENQLTTLDLSHNSALRSVNCWGNQLTTLDVSNIITLSFLDCAPMSTLATLKIAQGQEIPNVTTDRIDDYIPAETEIVVAPVNGGNEGTGDEEVTP